MKKSIRLWLAIILFSLLSLMCNLPEIGVPYIIGYPTIDPIQLATRAQQEHSGTLEALVNTMHADPTGTATPQPTNPGETPQSSPTTAPTDTPPPICVKPPAADLPANQGAINTRANGVKINAIHRSGQTFLTWSELEDISGERYRIYRSQEPITAENYQQLDTLYEVAEGSANFYANRYYPQQGDPWDYRYLERYVIEDNGSQLAPNTGLLVWTLHASDFEETGRGNSYYAVVILPGDGSDPQFSPDYALNALEESAADPQPVKINKDIGAGGSLYIQYMDLRNWNPTFNAPNPFNAYYGLSSSDPAVTGSIQYAYDYVVYQPEAWACGGSVPDSLPVVLKLHGWRDNRYVPFTGSLDQYWCAYVVYPYDMGETWYFGFARGTDYRLGEEPTEGDVIVNYTEQRLLRMLFDLAQNPPGPRVDFNRVYVTGHSMGGSGTLALALRYPNVFAAAYASAPMTNYLTSNTGERDWTTNLTYKWGRPELNLPVQIDALYNWADHLDCYSGTPAWDWQNHQQNLVTRRADEMVPFGVGTGLSDAAIVWSAQGQPAYAAFNASAQAWGGAVLDSPHTWLNFKGMPPSLGFDGNDMPFFGLRVIRDESVPGLSNASSNSPIPPETIAWYNSTILWSSSWNPWDGPPLDADAWSISLCSVRTGTFACGSGDQQTVDVTPRRSRQFIPQPGATYAWKNFSIAEGAVIAEGTVTTSEDGLLTIPAFAVSPGGNRLLIELVR